ncbi:Rhodanese-like protein [Backusella circina FSU 941]|nr:Rhodanese-like protein [Backusella circina FSU 941]
MASRRLLQQTAVQAVRISVNKPAVRAIARSSLFHVNKGAVSNYRPSLLLRHYSTSSVFKVVDYNDIQNTIKNDGKGYHLIDVREQKEVAQGAIPTFKNVPLSQFSNAWTLSDDDFQKQFGFDKPKKDSRVILYCLGGVRSTKAADILAQLGYSDLENYVGSWADYVEKSKEGK